MRTLHNKISLKLFILTLFFSSFSFFTVYASEIEQIKKNYVRSILSKDKKELEITNYLLQIPKEKYYGDQVVVDLMDRYPISEERIQFLLNIESNGSWNDVEYTSKDPSGWTPHMHMGRILELTKIFSDPSSSYNNSPYVEKVIHKALEYWFQAKLVSSNWWYNQIGIPKVLASICLLFEDKMTEHEMSEAIKILYNAKIERTGQNKIWLSGIVLVRGLLENDLSVVREARDAIQSEISIAKGTAEGIKMDHSFHQHGAQQQFGNYGAAYLLSLSGWAQIFEGTSLTFDQQAYDCLFKLVDQGYRRALWKGYMDINMLGRQLFHNAQRHKAVSVAFSSNSLSRVDSKNRAGYQQLIDENILNSTNPGVLGLYHFWMSDETVQRCSKWMVSVKMSSSRVTGVEAGNGDNKKGWYMADGATYTYMKGDEYENIFPYWNWRRIPGTTAYETDKPLKQSGWTGRQNTKPFVGNVNDGHLGMTVMDFSRDGLDARKAWVFTDEYVLCLGTAIKADSGCVVTTSIEQSKVKSDLFYQVNNAWENTIHQSFNGKVPVRFFHNNTGYIILDGVGEASIDYQEGNWNDIMSLYPQTMKSGGNVFSLYIDHGKDPDKATYQYLILPATTQDKISGFDLNKFAIIENTDQKQIVSLTEGTFLMAFYNAGEVRLSPTIVFRTDKPGLFLIKERKGCVDVVASDPTHKEESITVSINGQQKVISLPTDDYAGTTSKSILFHFK